MGYVGIPGTFGSCTARSGGWACPWGVAGKGLASPWVSMRQDPRSLLSPLSLPLPEWISIDKDEAGAKSKAPLCPEAARIPGELGLCGES